MGGMLAICDIKEYRTAAKALNNVNVDQERLQISVCSEIEITFTI